MSECSESRARSYEPRRPGESVLRRLLVDHLETFLAQAREGDESGAGLPGYVERELRAVVACGDPAAGFLRTKCCRCGGERLVPFSCRSRTLCPSCGARRMEAMLVHLVDRVLPDEPLRQWTVSFPFALRRLLAADAQLFSAVHRSFVRLVLLTLRSKAPPGQAGAISLIQKWDSNLGVDPHIHLCALDGVYVRRDDGTVEFVDAGPATSSDVETVATRLHGAIRRILLRRGLLTREGELAPRQSQEVTPLERLYEAAARDFIPSGTLSEEGVPHLRPRALPAAQRLGPLLVDVDGINVHADLRIEKGDRQGRERLLRYGLRPPFADDQIRLTPDGRIAFALRKARKNGDTHRFFTPLQFLRRLAWLIVPPRQALVRYEGVFAPRAALRARVVPLPPSSDDPIPVSLPEADPPGSASSRAAATRWASLLRRVYGVDALLCPKPGCGGRMRVVSAITSPKVIGRILEHLGLPTDLPAFAPRRAPPQATFSGFD